jgi:hypothetical protein
MRGTTTLASLYILVTGALFVDTLSVETSGEKGNLCANPWLRWDGL